MTKPKINPEHNIAHQPAWFLHHPSPPSPRYTEGTALILSLRVKLSNPSTSSLSDGNSDEEERERGGVGGEEGEYQTS